jgi:hypothetical protein
VGNISGIALGALSSGTKMIEIVVLAIVIIMLGVTLVLYRRNGRPGSGGGGRAKKAANASYYNDVGTLPMQPGMVGGAAFGPMGGGQPDPFAGFGGGAPAPGMAPPPPPPPPAPAPMQPPPGTPAGWMPDPSGAPDTLRYWDGASWTQHVAQRGA